VEESKTLKVTEKSIFRIAFLLEVSDVFKLVCFLEVLLIMVKAGSNVHTFCSTHVCNLYEQRPLFMSCPTRQVL